MYEGTASYNEEYVLMTPPRTGGRYLFTILQPHGFLGGGGGEPKRMSHSWSVPEHAKDFPRILSVRNPFSRLVSFYQLIKNHWQPNHQYNKNTFEEFVDFVTERENILEPLTHYIDDGTYIFIHFETFEDDFHSLPFINNEEVNLLRSITDWKSYYNNETKEKVRVYYAEDFTKFGYDDDF